MSLTLYDYQYAPSPRRARILLAEKGISYESVTVDLGTAEQLGDAYKAINPQCTVPALKLQTGELITEFAGIAAYAEALQPEPALLGSTAVEKGLVGMWLARIDQEGFMAVAEVVRNGFAGMKDRALTGATNYAQIPALAERGRDRLRHFWQVLDEQLAERDFLVGDSISAADISAMVVVDFASKFIKEAPAEQWGNLHRWHTAMAARPSAGA